MCNGNVRYECVDGSMSGVCCGGMSWECVDGGMCPECAVVVCGGSVLTVICVRSVLWWYEVGGC